MRRLEPRIRGFSARDDGISVTVVLVSMLALLGVAAFVIDVGALYEERRQLQNGADAAVLAIAYECAEDVTACQVDPMTTAEAYVDANARDAMASATNITFDPAERWVQVEVETDSPSGLLLPFFSQVFGNLGFDVTASARATFGYALSTPTIPLTLSTCEMDWQLSKVDYLGGSTTISDGDGIWEPDELTRLLTHLESPNGGPVAMQFFTKVPPGAQATEFPCLAKKNNLDAPGAFGWLDETACRSTVELFTWNLGGSNPGGNVPNDCKQQLLTWVGSPPLPIVVYGPVTRPTGPSYSADPAGHPNCDNVPTGDCDNDDDEDGASAQGTNTSYFPVTYLGLRIEGYILSGNPTWGQGGTCANPPFNHPFAPQVGQICGYIYATGVSVGEVGGGPTGTVSIVKLIPVP